MPKALLDAPSCLDSSLEPCDNPDHRRDGDGNVIRLRFPQEGNVRNVLEVLREKEDAIERIRREVEALRSVTPLLAGEMSSESTISTSPAFDQEVSTEMVRRQADTFAAAVPLFDEGGNDAFAKIRARLIEAGENNPQQLGFAKKISRHLRHFAAPLLSATLR